MLETLAKKAGAKYVAVPKGDLFLRFFKDFYPEDKLKKLAEEYRRFENKFREMGYKSADIALKVPFFKIPLTQPTEVNVTDYMLWKELK